MHSPHSMSEVRPRAGDAPEEEPSPDPGARSAAVLSAAAASSHAYTAAAAKGAATALVRLFAEQGIWGVALADGPADVAADGAPAENVAGDSMLWDRNRFAVVPAGPDGRRPVARTAVTSMRRPDGDEGRGVLAA